MNIYIVNLAKIPLVGNSFKTVIFNFLSFTNAAFCTDTVRWVQW